MKQKHNVQVEGLDIEFATGTLAGLASGAVTIRSGETELFVSATAASALRPGQETSQTCLWSMQPPLQR